MTPSGTLKYVGPVALMWLLGGTPAHAGGTLPYAELQRVEAALFDGPEAAPPMSTLTSRTSASGYTAGTSAEACAECHMPEYQQWEHGLTGHLEPTEIFTGGTKTAAMHRLALLDETFHHHYVDNGERDSCLRCHVPESVYTVTTSRYTYAPVSRSLGSANAAEGITCVSCHLDTDGNIRGERNYTLQQADHEVIADSVMFRDGSTLCQSCHGDIFWGALSNTFEQWEKQAKDSGLTCVDCHMVSLDDNTTPSHAFPGAHSPTLVKSAYSMDTPEVMTAGEAFRVVVCNQFAGHNMPTGDQFRAYVFDFTVRNAAGQVMFQTDKWVSPLFRTPVMHEVVEYDRVDPVPFLQCRDLVYPTLNPGTYSVDYEVGFWLLKPVNVKVVLPPGADDIQGQGEVYRVLDQGSYSLTVN